MTRPFTGRVILPLVVLVAVLLALPMVIALGLRPVAREKTIQLLEERFDDVELETLDVKLVPGLGFFPHIHAEGRNLSVSLPEAEQAPPFITMNEFSVEVGVLGLLRDPIRVQMLRLDELKIQIPPKRGDGDEDEPESGEEKNELPPAFVVEELVADGTVLRILPENPQKEPLQFDLHQLHVESAGLGQPMDFEAVLDNPKPPGEIQTQGKFGPLALPDPGSTPVSGEYVFERADLSVFGGIGGMLYSKGRFDGVLGRLEVEGFTETPDFRLKSAGHPVRLKTEFHAVVDGTNGDTLLRPVDAVVEESSFQTEGGIVDEPGIPGKTICLVAEGAEGRIEDFLRLAMKREPPLMSGGVRFTSKIVIPPGNVEVVEKLVLDGEFTIESARFLESKLQEKVNRLSEAGRGEKGKDDPEPSAPSASDDGDRVFSDIRGSFELQDGVMTISRLSFVVPGAEVTMEGTYGLVSEEIDFHGELRLQSELSDTTAGIKSFLLKIIDPLFRKKDTPAVIPIKVTGTADDPSFGVEMTRVLTRKEVARPAPRRSFGQWPRRGGSCSAFSTEKRPHR